MEEKHDNKPVYVEDNSGNIYKVMEKHFLQMSPLSKEQGNDRRVYELDTDNYHMITYQNACMIVNKQFRETNEEWEFNDKKFLAQKINDDTYNQDTHLALINMLPNHKVRNDIDNIIANIGEEHSEYIINNPDLLSTFKIIRHKGKTYYMLIINNYLPKVQLYDMFGKFCQMVNIKNCKPVFCLTDKKYI